MKYSVCNDWRANTGKRIDEYFVYEVDHFVYDQAEADRLNSMNNGGRFPTLGNVISR